MHYILLYYILLISTPFYHILPYPIIPCYTDLLLFYDTTFFLIPRDPTISHHSICYLILKGCLGPGEIKENAKDEKLGEVDEEQDAYFAHGLTQDELARVGVSDTEIHQEGGAASAVEGAKVDMEIVAAASASPCSSIGEGGGAKGDKKGVKEDEDMSQIGEAKEGGGEVIPTIGEG